MSKKKSVRYKSEKEILEKIDKYTTEIKQIGQNWNPEDARTKSAMGYRRNRLEALKQCLSELRTPMLHPNDFGDASVPERHVKTKVR